MFTGAGAYATGSAAGIVSGWTADAAVVVGVAVHRAEVVAASATQTTASASDAYPSGASHARGSAADADHTDYIVVVVKIDPDAERRGWHSANAVLTQRDGHDAVDVGQQNGHSNSDGHSSDSRRHQHLQKTHAE